MTTTVTLLLCGDVTLGRGIDQVLAYPGDPDPAEPNVRDARRYVEVAEEVSGPIPVPVEDTWPWGAALAEIAWSRPAVLVVNLETGVTLQPGPRSWPSPMVPAAAGCLPTGPRDADRPGSPGCPTSERTAEQVRFRAPDGRRRRRRGPRSLLTPPASDRGARRAARAPRLR